MTTMCWRWTMKTTPRRGELAPLANNTTTTNSSSSSIGNNSRSSSSNISRNCRIKKFLRTSAPCMVMKMAGECVQRWLTGRLILSERIPLSLFSLHRMTLMPMLTLPTCVPRWRPAAKDTEGLAAISDRAPRDQPGAAVHAGTLSAAPSRPGENRWPGTPQGIFQKFLQKVLTLLLSA